jgi:hypothetical protein
MGGPLVCDLCEDPSDPVLFLVTAVENGDTIAVGGVCYPVWARGTEQILYPEGWTPPGDEAAAGVSTDGGEPGDGAEAPAPAKRAKKPTKAEATTEAGEAHPETAAG